MKNLNNLALVIFDIHCVDENHLYIYIYILYLAYFISIYLYFIRHIFWPETPLIHRRFQSYNQTRPNYTPSKPHYRRQYWYL
jgi:hypothetical protein